MVVTNTSKTLEIMVDEGKLEQVQSFGYLGIRITTDADCAGAGEVKTRLAMGMAAMVKLTKMWKNKAVSTNTKLRLMKALVWPVATYGCEAWTLKKEEERRIQAFKNKCIRKLLRIPWTRLLTTKQVYEIAKTESELRSHIKSGKLCYFGHVMRHPHDSIEGSVMVGLVEGTSGRGRARIGWLDNITTWTSLSGASLL